MTSEDYYITGQDLLTKFGCKTREEKLERAVKALMSELEDLHRATHRQSLKENLTNQEVFCSCADAYRMGDAALIRD